MHRIITIGALFSALSSTTPSAAESKSPVNAKDICRQGKSQYASGDVIKAIKSLGKCVDQEPRNREAWIGLANANLEAGQFGPSVAAFAKAATLKPGDEKFLASYLSALEGAGETVARIPVLRAWAGMKAGDRKRAEVLLAAVEATGPDRFPDEYLFALQTLTEGPGPDRYNMEKLAAAYLKRGNLEKAEAEYRGLLVKNAESADAWAGLGASQISRDPAAAAECYRKAAFYSNNAGQRTFYQNEHARLARTASAPPAAVAVQDPVEVDAGVPARAKPAVAASKPKPFDVKAYQDSVYKVELEKRLAALQLSKTTPPAPVSPASPSSPAIASATPSIAAGAVSATDQSASAGAEDKKLREARAREEKERQDSLARENEKRAKAEKEAQKQAQKQLAKQEEARQDSISKVMALKAKEEKSRQEAQAREQERQAKEEKERLAKSEKARQDSLAQEADRKAAAAKLEKAEKERAELAAKVEQNRRDSLSRENEKRAKAEKEAQKEAQKQLAKLEEARRDSISKVMALKAKEEKSRQEAQAREQDRQAKEEKERVAREAERKRSEEARARKLQEDQDKSERVTRERKERYELALALYQRGRMDSAALVFKAVLADSPSAEAYFHAGRAYLAKGDFSKALEALEKAPRDQPGLEGLKGRALMGLGRHKEAVAAVEAQYGKSNADSLLPDLIALKRKNGDEAGAIAYLEILAGKKAGEPRHQEELAAYYKGKGDRAKASTHYSRLFILNTSHPEANFWLGMEAVRMGDNAQAVPMLERVVAAHPKRLEAWKALAKADAALGRKEQAWEAYGKAFALSPSDLETAQARLGLARESRPSDLIPAYEDVLRLSPQDAETSLGLARIRFQEGDFAGAEKHYRVACKDSKDPQAWAGFGRSLLELKKNPEAAGALQKAVELGEKDPSLRLDLVRIRIHQGDLDGSEALLKDMAKQAPSDPEPLYWQGQIALQRNQTAVAEEFFRKSQQLKPDEGRYAEPLARLLRDKEDCKSAVAVLARAEAKLTLAGRLLHGDCLAQGGDFPKAKDVYAELYRKEPSAPLLSRRMDLLVRMGMADQAVELVGGAPFRDATEVRFSLAKAQLSLAAAHVLKGDVDQAVDLMKMVVKTDTHNPEYHYYLGLGFYDQKRPKKALGEFMDAIAYRAEYPEAQYHRGLCQLQLEDARDAESSFGELSQHGDPVWKARGLYGLAMAFEAQNKPEAVLHHLELSVAASPLPEAMASLSRVCLKQNRVAEAHDWARKALSADPSNETATVALADALASGKRQAEAMELARQGLRAKPLSCGLLVQTAKLNFEAGRLDSSLAMSNDAIRICPEEKMAYYYAGVSTRGSNRPKEAKQYFKSFRKLGGDRKLVPAE